MDFPLISLSEVLNVRDGTLPSLESVRGMRIEIDVIDSVGLVVVSKKCEN